MAMLTVSKPKVQYATTVMTENIMSDSSRARPPMNTAPDIFGTRHISRSPTATVNPATSLSYRLPTLLPTKTPALSRTRTFFLSGELFQSPPMFKYKDCTPMHKVLS